MILVTVANPRACLAGKVDPEASQKPSAWRRTREGYARALDSTVFVCLAALVLYTVSKHEPWADEADTWLEVRDLHWLRLLFGELRYDGHLPLWHSVIWVGMHVFRVTYDHFVFIGGVCGITGLAILIFLAPFPRALRYIIAGSFFFAYQYAVIARPYVLMPLLGFLAAHFYRQGLARIYSFAIVTGLLIQDSSYAAVVGTGLAGFYAWQLAPRWNGLQPAERKRVWVAGAVIAASLVFGFIVLLPPSDSSLVSVAAHLSLSYRLDKFGEGITGAFAEGSAVAALPLLFLACLWSYIRRGWLLLVLIVGGTALEYGFLRGFGHHQGLITIAFVVFAWAMWPRAEELAKMPEPSRVIHYAFAVVVALTFGWQWSWSYAAMKGDWSAPYSGAQDAAQYLKSVGAEKLGIGGYTFWSVGVQPYFPHNIYLNYGGPEAPARYHFAIDFETRASQVMSSQLENGPAFIVFAPEVTAQEAVPIIEDFRRCNYVLVHYSPGTKFFKNNSSTPSPYFIFERADFSAAMGSK